MQIYKCRNCFLNTVERRVIKDRKYLDLTPKSFDVLQLLVESSGEIVTKDEMLGKVWNGSFVEEGNLPVHISKLRRSLGETGTEHFIETVQGAGYRFVASVEAVTVDFWSDLAAPVIAKSNGQTENAESHRLYLKGKYLCEKRSKASLIAAITCFEKSAASDPTNILAYVETVECYLLLYFFDYASLTETTKRIAPLLSIISQLGDSIDSAQAMWGIIKMCIEWKFDEAEKHFQHALILNPNSVLARYRYSGLLTALGRFSEALKQLHQILLIDPMSLLTYKRIARVFWKMGQHESAMKYLDDVIDLDSNDYEAYALSGSVLTELGRLDEAIAMFNRSLGLQTNLEILSMIGYVRALKGEDDKARQIIAEVSSVPNTACSSAIQLAKIYLALGEKGTAFTLLEKAFREHESDLIGLGCDPRFKSIKAESRFKSLISRIGLSESIVKKRPADFSTDRIR